MAAFMNQEVGVRVAPASPPTGAVVKQYVEDLTAALAQLETDAMSNLLDTLVLALRAGSRVFVAGNGGSSTAAIHIASDLVAASHPLSDLPQVMALTENIARITAIANDFSYEEIFSRQLMGWGRPGDVLLLLSVSGSSTNLVRAAKVSRKRGMTVLAALGNAGELAGLADRQVIFGQADYGLTEDLHVALGHMAVRVLRGGVACRYRAASGDGDATTAAPGHTGAGDREPHPC